MIPQTAVFALFVVTCSSSLWNKVSRVTKALEDIVYLQPAEDFIRQNGYPAETHHTLTDDGYVLHLGRIPRHGRTAVLMGNGLSCNAACYCVLGPESMAFKVYDAGFDVWLGDFRGHGRSLNHTRFTMYEHAFWQFTFHEHGLLDIPAMMDHVLAVTGQRSLLYAAHSLGATAFLVMASLRPEHARRVQGAFLMAPVAFLAHAQGSLRALHAHENRTVELEQRLGPNALVSTRGLARYILALVCAISPRDDRVGSDCPIFQLYETLDSGEGHAIFSPEYRHVFPSTTSLLEVLHYAQLANPKWPGFRKFNHGLKRNRLVYGQDTPPDYNLSSITVPVHVYLGATDHYTRPPDFQMLKSALPDVRKVFLVPIKKFGHIDFILNPAAPKHLYRVFIADMLHFLRSQNKITRPFNRI